MKEFTLTPSEKVWGKIQADISTQKKKKITWLPAAMLLGIFLLSTFILKDLEKRQHPSGSSISFSTDATVRSASKTPVYLDGNEVVSVKQKSKAQLKTTTSLNEVDLNETKKLVKVNKNQINDSPAPVTTMNAEEKINEVIPNSELQQDKHAEKEKMNDGIIEDNTKTDSTVAAITVQKNLNNTDGLKSNEKKQEQELKDTKTASNQKSNNKWDYLISFSAGRFSTGNSYLGQIANSAYYDGNSTSNSTGGGIPNAAAFGPAPIQPGLSFSVALKANRNITSKTNIFIGLGYQYGETSVTTGQSLSGSARDSFAAGTTKKFYNKYHFIQLPLGIQSLIGKGNKLPLSWNAGFVFSRLISADVLQFDNTQSRYYKDNNLFNKSSIGISAGLSLAILKKQKTQWLIGPEFYYSLTPVADIGLYDKTHYSFLGLQIQKKL